jgi:integrase
MLKEDNVRRGFVEDADFDRLAAKATEPWLRTFLELAFTYGWRRGELLGLRVRQLNFAARTMRLDVGTTKNGEGREVRAGLAQLVCRKCGCPADPIPPKAKRLRGQHGSVYRCPQCLASKHRAFRYEGLIPHDMRRSAAKALRAAGVAESVIMATGGWRTPSMLRRYAIVSSADQRAVVELLERARAERNSGPVAVALESGRQEGQGVAFAKTQ